MTSQHFVSRFHPNWREYSSLRVYIESLPYQTLTIDIHKALKHAGTVVRIDILRPKARTTLSATIDFSPPPHKEIWADRNGVEITLSNGHKGRYLVKLSKQQKETETVESPVRPGVRYPVELILNLRSIAFGIMKDSKSMAPMVTRSAEDRLRPQMILNTRLKEIEVRFPSYLNSENSGAMRYYRCFIALDDNFDLWTTTDAEQMSIVFHVNSPPQYARKLIQRIADSHSDDMWYWSENDLWARQTDIVDHKNIYEIIDQTPVSLRKNLNSINIARWTTFKLDFELRGRNAQLAQQILQVLHDFNVEAKTAHDFKVLPVRDRYEAPIWGLMDDFKLRKALDDLKSEDLKLDNRVRYQLEVCVSHGWLNEYNLTEDFLRSLKKLGDKAVLVLSHLDSFQERLCDPTQLFTDIRFQRPVRQWHLPEGQVYIYRATVTASSIKYYTPVVECSNRILRKYKQYADRFLRVNFEDDEYRGKTRLFPSTNNKMDLIYRRVKRTLRHGIKLGEVHYEFLAWGNSQLREHSAYFFAATPDGLNASKIRAGMGAFDNEKVVAKRAARMGQCFSTTNAIHLKLPLITAENTIPDVQVGKYNFTDGVGQISTVAAKIVQNQLKICGHIPSVFQFRLGGCKGVLTLSPELKGTEIKIRPSQFKFNSLSGELEIIRVSQFWQACLNRQLILVFSYLGVRNDVFLRKQQHVIDAVNGAMTDDELAIKALHDNIDPNQTTLVLSDLVSAGFRRSGDPFLVSLMNLWRAWTLKYLKEKAKIPLVNGALLLGCVDETGLLKGHFEGKEGKNINGDIPEVFVQITDAQTSKQRVIEGICAIARNPSLHPGDIRVVKAVDKPELHHLCDVLVMPRTGDRDLPSMCSGGDLDGDDYVVIWDEDLIPKTWNTEPFHYNAPSPKEAVKEITTNDIIDFFVEYMQNDFLGRIATAHLARADNNGEYDHGLTSEECLELVELHSTSVDFPKTGIPATLRRGLEPTFYPHFMGKRKSYKSLDILGKLYDAVKRIEYTPAWTDTFDQRILNFSKPNKEMFAVVTELKLSYDTDLQRIMAQHRIATEFEVWSTFVLDHSKAGRDFKFHEEIGQLSRTLKDCHRQAIVEIATGDDFEHLAPWAVAAYCLTRRQVKYALEGVEAGERELSAQGMPFISFPWLLQETLTKIANLSTIQGLHMESNVGVGVSNCGDTNAEVSTDEDHVSTDTKTLAECTHSERDFTNDHSKQFTSGLTTSIENLNLTPETCQAASQTCEKPQKLTGKEQDRVLTIRGSSTSISHTPTSSVTLSGQKCDTACHNETPPIKQVNGINNDNTHDQAHKGMNGTSRHFTYQSPEHTQLEFEADPASLSDEHHTRMDFYKDLL